MQITSVQNRRVKTAMKLRNHRERIAQRRFLIDGTIEIQHAIAGGVELVEVFICPTMLGDCSDDFLMSLSTVKRWDVTPHVWEKLAYGNRRDGILAVGRLPELQLSSLQLHLTDFDEPLIVVLEGVEKPGNIGAVVRTADAAGAHAVIVTQPVGDLYNPNAIRASRGTIFRLPVISTDNQSAQAWLAQRAVNVFVTTVDAARGVDYATCDWKTPTAMVLGSEANGVSDAWRDPSYHAVTIPMRGTADSLNLSASAAILLYEAARQRRS